MYHMRDKQVREFSPLQVSCIQILCILDWTCATLQKPFEFLVKLIKTPSFIIMFIVLFITVFILYGLPPQLCALFIAIANVYLSFPQYKTKFEEKCMTAYIFQLAFNSGDLLITRIFIII